MELGLHGEALHGAPLPAERCCLALDNYREALRRAARMLNDVGCDGDDYGLPTPDEELLRLSVAAAILSLVREFLFEPRERDLPGALRRWYREHSAAGCWPFTNVLNPDSPLEAAALFLDTLDRGRVDSEGRLEGADCTLWELVQALAMTGELEHVLKVMQAFDLQPVPSRATVKVRPFPPPGHPATALFHRAPHPAAMRFSKPLELRRG
jgi:hypothetical protein